MNEHNVVPIRKPISEHGVLIFQCPKCEATLEVGLHIYAHDEPSKTSPVTKTHYGHPVDFVGQAPHLHAEFWGHMVRCHQPNPHPYLTEKISYVCTTCHAHWDQHDNRELCCPAYTSEDGSVVFRTTLHYTGELPPNATSANHRRK